jgi:murein DD-endopeptidase MepM/ murein hydrolase activator NlpD
VAQDDGKAKAAAPGKTTPAAAQRAKQQLGWGNLIVIEHKLPDGTYATSIYGHLANRRSVETGDIVQAGQVIGTVAKSKLENGGYDPHLHFAVREGRIWEPSGELLSLRVNGKPAAVKIVDLSETEVQVEVPESVSDNFQMTIGHQTIACTTRDGKHFLPAGALNVFEPREFSIVGYGLTTDGFLDPTLFLQQMRADSLPAPFGRFPAQQAKAK